jgi:starvation-inducible DNA-binding protein
MSVIVTDLDDTLILSGDRPNVPMLNLLLDAHQQGDRIIVVSGRALDRMDETVNWLNENGLEVADADIHLSDFPAGPNASQAFKVFKAKKLIADGVEIEAWYENDADTRAALKAVGVPVVDPASVRAVSPASTGAPVPTSFGTHEDPKTSAPQEMRDNAHDGLKFYAMGLAGDGVTSQTIREARDMVKGIVSNDKWMRIRAWVARHRVDWEKVSANHDLKDPKYPGPGAVAAFLWGVDPTDPDSADKVIQWATDALAKTGNDTMNPTRDMQMIDETVEPAPTLVDGLKQLQADVFTMYVTAQGFHWNVTGCEFAQYHKFFGKIYEDVYGSIDGIAESLRKLDVVAPFRLTDLLALREVEDSPVTDGNYLPLVDALYDINDEIIDELMEVFDAAVAAREQGIANFLAERIDQHEQWRWQLKASMGDYAKSEMMEPDTATGENDQMLQKFVDLYKSYAAGE